MDHSLRKADLVSSALRIYLSHTLNQTEDIIKATRQKMTMSTALFHSGYSTEGKCPEEWKVVLTCAEKVSVFIKNCQRILETSPGIASVFFHGLCVVGAFQDALNEALLAYRCYSKESCYLHVSLSDRRTCKANYLIYAYEAAQRDGDQKLSALWCQAAHNLSEELELNLRDSQQPTPMMMRRLENVESERVKIAEDKHAWSAKCLDLHLRALYHHRCSAAMSALNRLDAQIDHEYAAQVCVEAADVRAQCDAATDSSEVALMERAATLFQAAVDVAELHRGGKNDSQLPRMTIETKVYTAQRLIRTLPQVQKLVTALDKVKVDLAATVTTESSCRDATMLPVWRILRTEQESAILKYEKLIKDAIYGDGLGDLSGGLIAYLLTTVTNIVHEIGACRQRAIFYKQKAVQSLQRDQSSGLANECWTQAAVHMEAAALVCIDFILKGDYFTEDLNDVPDWKSHCEHSKHLLCIVECVLPRADVYMDKARGAEAGVKNGRDPREAQMWRKAADVLFMMARFMLTDKSGSAITMCKNIDSDVFTLATSAVEPAEFFYMAFKHRALPDADTRQNGTRVAVFYERAAALLYEKQENHDMDDNESTIDDVVKFYKNAIARFNVPTLVPAEELRLWETASECGMMACNTEIDAFIVHVHWYSAFCLAKELLALPEVKRKMKDATVLKARLALEMCAAQTKVPEALLGYEACLSVLSDLPSAVRASAEFSALRQYHIALLEHVIDAQQTVLGAKAFTVPAEVKKIFSRVFKKEHRVPKLQSHAQALLLRTRCHHRMRDREGAESDKWDEAYRAVNDVCQTYMLCAVELPAGQNSPSTLAHLAYLEAVARCYVGAAESFVLQPVSANDATRLSEAEQSTAEAWEEAVEMCKAASAVSTTAAVDSRNAFVAVERHLWAAEQAQAMADAVRRGDSPKQVMEMIALGELLKEVALAAGGVYRQPEQQEVLDNYNEAEARAKGAVELRRSRGLSTTAYPSS